jgi:hypothetical protein
MAIPQGNDGFPLRHLGPGNAPADGLSSGGHGWMDQFAKNTWAQQKDPFGSTKPWDGRRRQHVPEDFAKTQVVSVTVILDAYTSSPMMRKILPLEITSAGFFEAKQWQFTPQVMGPHAYMAPYGILRGKQTSTLTNMKQFILGLQAIDEMDLTEPGAFIRSQLYIALRKSVEITILLQQTRALLMCPDIVAKQAEVASNSNCTQQQVIERQIELFENTALVLSRHSTVEDPLSAILYHTNRILRDLRTNPTKVDFIVMQQTLLDKFALNYTRQDYTGPVADSVIQYILSTVTPNPAELKLALPPISLIAMSGVTVAPVYPAISDSGPIDDLAGTLTTGHFNIVPLDQIDRVDVISYTSRQRKAVIDRGANGRRYTIRKRVYDTFFKHMALPAPNNDGTTFNQAGAAHADYHVNNSPSLIVGNYDAAGVARVFPRRTVAAGNHAQNDVFGVAILPVIGDAAAANTLSSERLVNQQKHAFQRLIENIEIAIGGEQPDAADIIATIRHYWSVHLHTVGNLPVVPVAGVGAARNIGAIRADVAGYCESFLTFITAVRDYLRTVDLGTAVPENVATRYNTFVYPTNQQCNDAAPPHMPIAQALNFPLRAIVIRQYGFATSTIISGIGGGESAGKTYIGRSAEGTSWNADRRTNDDYTIIRVGVGIFQQTAIVPVRHAAIADYLWGGDALPLPLAAGGNIAFPRTSALAGFFYTQREDYAEGIHAMRAGADAQLGNGDTFMYIIPPNDGETPEAYVDRCDTLDRQSYLDAGGVLPFADRVALAYRNNHTWTRVPTHLKREDDDPAGADGDDKVIPSTLIWAAPSWQRKTGDSVFTECGAKRGLISHEPHTLTSWTQATTPRAIAV